MKRILLILLTLLSLLPLAACGKTEEYTYDYIPPEYPEIRMSLGSLANKKIKSGALLYIAKHELDGKEKNSEQSDVAMVSIFSEHTKTIAPLCTDPNCTHNNVECFGDLYGHSYTSYSGIYEDSVFIIKETSKQKGHTNVNGLLETVYYGLDGTIKDTVVFTPALFFPDGSPLENTVYMPEIFTVIGSKVYIQLSALNTGDNEWVLLDQSQLKYFHWVVCYDLDNREWSYIATFPHSTDAQFLNFRDANESMLTLQNNGVGYTVDISTGEVTEYDCAAILDEMIAKGELPTGTMIAGIYPTRDFFDCYQRDKTYYIRISTKEFIDPSEARYLTVGGTNRFTYSECLYTTESMAGQFTFTNCNTNERTDVETPGVIMSFFSETENGIIFSYRDLLEDGSIGPDCYTVKENYRDVTYFYPRKFLYVTKEDILDGTIDEPWFYDPETYSFVLQ